MWVKKPEYRDFLMKVWSNYVKSGFLNKVEKVENIHFKNLSRKINGLRDEIEVAIQGMSPTKALGPDGLPLIFFQSGRTTVEDDVMEMTQNFFIYGKFVEG